MDETGDAVIIDRNKSGFMDCKMFCSYVQKVAVPYLDGLPGPLLSTLITLDGHYSQIHNTELIDLVGRGELKS